MTDPIEPHIQEAANKLATVIDTAINPDLTTRRYGFCLLMFPFGENQPKDRMNYISNSQRPDMLAAMKEFIARAEGRYLDPAKTVHRA